MRIRDVLLVGPEELAMFCRQYPDCVVSNLTGSAGNIQQYQVSVHVDNEEDYYEFLIDNCIAMSSQMFYSRVKSDPQFAVRMKHRI